MLKMKHLEKWMILILTAGTIFLTLLFRNNPDEKLTQQQAKSTLFTNPLLESGADPWIIHQDSFYHYCYSSQGSIWIKTVNDIRALATSEGRAIWTPPPGREYSKEIWAPELHSIDDVWYVYFAADDGDNANHRMYVLRSEDESIESDFSFMGQIADSSDKWSIDGTVWQYNGKRYFIWSGWEGDINEQQNLYIAEMASPTQIKGPRVLISSPEYEWEKRGSSEELPTINEGPQVLQNSGVWHIVYSASGSWSDHYCLGRLQLTGTDPLQKSSWTKIGKPVFEGTDCVISPGHCSFFKIGKQDWIVYHTAKYPGAGWDRQVKMQPFYWVDHEPAFGVPVQDGVLLPIELLSP